MSKESLVTAGGVATCVCGRLPRARRHRSCAAIRRTWWVSPCGSDASGAEGGKASVASVSLDGTVRIWDLRANCESHVFQCWPESRSAEAEMAAVSIFPTGNAVAAGGVDGTVRLFDMRAYATVAELTAKPVAAPITGIECSLSGRAIYTSHADRDARRVGALERRGACTSWSPTAPTTPHALVSSAFRAPQTAAHSPLPATTRMCAYTERRRTPSRRTK